MASASILSVKDGAVLSLTPIIGHVDPDRFDFTLTTPVAAFAGSASTYFVGSPALFFSRLADSWRGWEGDLTWKTLENEFTLTASSDHLGHVQILVELKSAAAPSDWEFKYRLYLDAGMLESLAQQFRQAFPVNAKESHA